MARTVVADAGPLIAFASVDLLYVLKALFSQVTITESWMTGLRAAMRCAAD